MLPNEFGEFLRGLGHFAEAGVTGMPGGSSPVARSIGSDQRVNRLAMRA